MDPIPDDLQTLGRRFLDALVARLGQLGAASVLVFLAAEMRRGRANLLLGSRGAPRSPPDV